MNFEKNGVTYEVRLLNCSSDEQFLEERIVRKRLSYITAGTGNCAADIISKSISAQDIQGEREKLSTIASLFERCMGAKALPKVEIDKMVFESDPILVQWWSSSTGLSATQLDSLRKALLVWLTPKEIDEISIKEGLALVKARSDATKS